MIKKEIGLYIHIPFCAHKCDYCDFVSFSNKEDIIDKYINKNIIRKRKGMWYIMNPVNPNDNLADSWNDNPEKAEIFFKWVKAMKKDCLDSMKLEDNDFVALLENNFGREYVKKNVKLENYVSAVPNVIMNTPKPWGR